MGPQEKKYCFREDTIFEKQKEDSLFIHSVYDNLLLEGLLDTDLSFILSFKTGVNINDPRLSEERKRSIFLALKKIRALRLMEIQNKELEFMNRNVKWISHFTDDVNSVINTLHNQHITILNE